MKKETKELVEWIKESLNEWASRTPAKEGDNTYFKSLEFLDSLPKIESHLCKGGYIRDRNGTPCCNGDKVQFEFEDKAYEENWKDKYSRIMNGVLQFSVETKSFCIVFGPEKYGYDWIDWTTSDYGCKWFEKVE